MSWITLNEMLGLAATNRRFCQQLLREPVAAARAWGFDLTPDEERVLQSIAAHDLQEFSEAVSAHLDPENRPESDE